MTKIAFFGTPNFGVPALEYLITSGANIAAVITQPNTNRKKSNDVLVESIALANNLPLYQPKELKQNTVDGDEFFKTFQDLNIDLAIVVAYGQFIPKRFLNLPKLGFINIHPSLLPRWRGAAPIQRAIEAGDSVAGISLMKVSSELDAGDVYHTELVDLTPALSAPEWLVKFSNLGAQLLKNNLSKIIDGSLTAQPQSLEGVTYANMLTKEEGLLDFNQSAIQLFNKCRALDGWPGVHTAWDKKVIKLFDPVKCFGTAAINGPPGTVVALPTNPNNCLIIQTGDGLIGFKEIQLASKNRMSIWNFLLGHKLMLGTILGVNE